jgi:glycosyltransferase involved in cell wall biosynthesis
MISILLPIYNGYEYFKESYSSIQAQTYKNWQLLIGVNGHEKDSVVYNDICHLTQQESRVQIYQYPEIKSKSKTLNTLLQQSKNSIICLIDVDDKWHKDKILKQISFMNDFDIVGTGCRYFGDRNDKPNIPYGKVDSNIFNFFNPIINSSSMFLKKYAYWDETLDGLEDYELWLRLNKEGKTFFNLEEELCYHRVHNSSYFNTKDFSNLEYKIKNKYK